MGQDELFVRTWSRRRFVGAAAAGGTTALVVGCTGGMAGGPTVSGGRRPTVTPPPATEAASRTDPAWPGPGGWQTVQPRDVGWDPVGLRAALDFAASRGSRALVLALDGSVLAEGRWGVGPAYRQDIASCQKSVVAVLVGIAQQRGLLSIGDPVSRYLGSGWSNAGRLAERRITIRHLLTMTSGLTDSFDVEASPGTVWWYNSNAYHRLQAVLEKVARASITDLSQRWLWDPIGVTSALWQPRPGSGRYSVDPKGNRIWSLSMTAHDMGRFGLLVQRGGTWAGRPVVADSRYLADALSTSQSLNPSYGYLWWLNGQKSYQLPNERTVRPGPLFPAAPADLVSALGAGDQKIYVSRDRRLVMTRLGSGGGAGFDNALWSKVLAAAP
ncbi:MAG: serine hydrolase [Actinobacteria bacterium]|nr:serine hydrolase [Actinomycetota bacterium]